MSFSMLRLAPLAGGALLALTACSQQPARHATTEPASAATAQARHHVHHPSPHPAATPPAHEARSARTGIPACDAYLSTYLACHRAAGIFPPDQLQGRYQAMRDSLLRDSRDPDIRPQLGSRCRSLSASLRDALHGKSCNAPLPVVQPDNP
jgi:hypothetical protein